MDEADPGDKFKKDLMSAFGDIINSDPEIASEVWSAITGVTWYHEEGTSAQLSMEEASEVVHHLLGKSDDEPWWAYGPDGVVSSYVERVMKKEGWVWI